MGGRAESSGRNAARFPEFEYDPAKSASNLKKHGAGFDRVRALWDDPLGFDVAMSREGEVRLVRVGTMDDRPWLAVWTRRQDKVRIISFRRTNEEEVARLHEEGQR